MMTDLSLEELERLEAKATPGPWAYEPHGDTGEYGVGVIVDENAEPIVGYNEDSTRVVAEPVAVQVNSSCDAAFIAASRAALPQLIAEVRRLRKENQDYESDREALTGILLEAEQLVPGIQNMQEYDAREAGRCIAQGLIAAAQEHAEKTALLLAKRLDEGVDCPPGLNDLKQCPTPGTECADCWLKWADVKAKAEREVA